MDADRKLIGGRWVRWNDERAADAYIHGWWVHHTLADSLREATPRTPRRVALAHALQARIPAGSVVSFMLPN